MITNLLLSSVLTLSTSPTANPTDLPQVQRVGGDREVQTELKVNRFRSGQLMVEESLPVGYPRPTPAGAIEIKAYPGVRRAEVRSSDASGVEGAFFPLFNHIQQRDIAMTSPVEVDLQQVSQGDRETSEQAMSFLYRTSDLGDTGRDGRVIVRDVPPIRVLSLGIVGAYGPETYEPGLDQLQRWLDGQSEWVADGEPRALFYNGPHVPDSRKWSEIQIPIRSTSLVTAGQRLTFTTDTSAGETVQTPEPASATPITLIELAVKRGAPLFNDGSVAACAAVYEITVVSLLAMERSTFTESTRRKLSDALASAEHLDGRRLAWSLRRAMDAAWLELRRAND